MLIARSPVRISFAGGGTDLPSYYNRHGGVVLSTSINKYVYTILTAREDRLTQVISSDFRVTESYEDIAQRTFEGAELDIPLACLKFMKFRGGVNLFMASEIPAGTGLGSSGAVCVNLLKILAAYLHLRWSKQDLAERAFQIAREMLHKPVGKQDEYAAAFGGLNIFRFQEERAGATPVRLPADVISTFEESLMLFFTGTARNSSDILTGQDQQSAHGVPYVTEALHQQKALVGPMAKALEKGDLDDFGDLLHHAWEVKRRLSPAISNSLIDEVYEAARSAGARGGKIAGAGGGGFLLLYCPPREQEKVRQALGPFGLKEMFFGFDSHGSRVVYNDPFFDCDRRGGMRWLFREAGAAGAGGL